ncbi:MAG: HlyD family efflux transporter periplasmic adaptor subunit [Clostridia bacterium]|nr:HlyD family efflux transporter periplasmic adaptor subunit [Clostridia bacterium]
MYQPMPPMPPRQQPQAGQGRKRLSIFQIMLIVAVLGFAVWYTVTALTPDASPYAQIMSGSLGARYSGDCLIVRDETPFDAEGVSSIEYLAEEGVAVSRSTAICEVYSSGFSTREMTALQDYRDQIKEYQLKLLSSEVATDSRMDRLETEVLNRAREVRKLISGTRGNMSNQEQLMDAAIKNRQTYLKQKYSNDQRMTRLLDDEQSQKQRISSWTKQYVAMTDAVVSFYSDGYEYGLTVSNYDQFTPQDVRAMINGSKPDKSTVQKGKTTIYRMVRDGYYYVLFMVRDTGWNPVEGQVYQLKMESFQDTTVDATVLSFTRTGGELLVRLGVNASVKPVLYMRTCTAELGDNVASLMVPQKAIYYQDNMPGVVVVDGQYQTFIPINIINKKDNWVFISAIQQGVLFEGQTVRLF